MMSERSDRLSVILDRIAFCPDLIEEETERELTRELAATRADLAIPPELGALLVELLGIPTGARVFDPDVTAGMLYLNIRDRLELSGMLSSDPLSARLSRLILPRLKVVDGALTECPGVECFDYVTGIVPVGANLIDRDHHYDHAEASGAIRSELAWFETAIRLVRPGGAIALVVTSDALRQMMTPTVRWWLASRAREVAKIYLPKGVLRASHQVCLVLFEKRPAVPTVTSFRFVLPDFSIRTGVTRAWSAHLKRNHEIRLQNYALSVAARLTPRTLASMAPAG